MGISGQRAPTDARLLPAEHASQKPIARGSKVDPQSPRENAPVGSTKIEPTTPNDAQGLRIGDDIRADKVEALRQAIAEGRYKVSPLQIAMAMIRDGLGW
jgi:flagellar biosynthesis anti-sigma factor FlgM